MPRSRSSLPQNAPIEELKSRTRYPERSWVMVVPSVIRQFHNNIPPGEMTVKDRGWKIEDRQLRSAVLDLQPFPTLTSAVMISDDMLCQPPTQNFWRAFSDAYAAHLTVPPLQRQLAHEPQSAVHLDRAVDNAARHFGAHDLGHIGQLANIFAAVMAPGAFINHQPARVQFHRRVRNHELNRLAVCQGLAEGGAHFGVFDHHIQRAGSDAAGARAVAADAPFFDPFLRDRKPLAFRADAVRRRNFDVVKMNLSRRIP